jgi:6-pyruvoyltetrahydropterin/6-carboxytetrahydropterin synthase
MTVFPDGTKESLHGHNYYVEVVFVLDAGSSGKMIPFSVLKTAIEALCEAWDEKVLLAEKNPLFEIKTQTKSELEFILCKKRYVLPKDEVVLLNLENITIEALSAEFGKELLSRLGKIKEITSIETTIEETRGQSVTSVVNSSSS